MSARPVRVLVTGAGGQVGMDLVDTLRGVGAPGAKTSWQPDRQRVGDDEFLVLALTHHELDVTSSSAVARAMEMSRPDVIVNLAAYTAVDRAEGDVALCEFINRDAVANLSRCASESGSHLITLSTDYVFNGEKGSPYEESDEAHPLNVYGRSKREGELLCGANDTVVRTSWVLSVRGRTVLDAIIDRVRRGETVRFVNDQLGTLTSSADLSRALITLVRARPGGVWHVANNGAVTWYDIAAATARLVDGEGAVVPIATADLSPPQVARRPVRSDLATRRWIDAGWSELSPWDDALQRILGSR